MASWLAGACPAFVSVFHDAATGQTGALWAMGASPAARPGSGGRGTSLMRKALALSLLSAVTGTVLSVAPVASAEVAAVKYVPVEIHLGNMPGSGKVIVYLEVAKNLSNLGVPQELVDIPLATIPLRRTGTLQIKLPVTKQVLADASSGLADYTFAAWFGNSRATSEASVPVAPKTGNLAGTDRGSIPAIMFAPFEKVPSSEVPDPVFPCRAVADGRPVEKTNLIGQMQDSSSQGSQVSWDYGASADSTFGVAVSDSPTKNYTVSGSFSITNSMSGSGGFSSGPGFNSFVYGHFYRQRYKDVGFCSKKYKTKFVSAVGDSFPAPTKAKKPAKDPYGRCSRDPHGLAAMAPKGGHFNSDRAKATTYSFAATIYNVTVSGSTGYTSDITISYNNNSKRYEYVCGDAQLPNAPKLWSNNSQGK